MQTTLRCRYCGEAWPAKNPARGGSNYHRLLAHVQRCHSEADRRLRAGVSQSLERERDAEEIAYGRFRWRGVSQSTYR